MVAFMAVLFPGIVALLPKLPNKLINLQNKDYWLSPERRNDTFAFLSRWFLWFGSATFLLLLDGYHQALRVNMGSASALEHPLTSIVVYLVFTVLWIGGLIAKFMRRS